MPRQLRAHWLIVGLNFRALSHKARSEALQAPLMASPSGPRKLRVFRSPAVVARELLSPEIAMPAPAVHIAAGLSPRNASSTETTASRVSSDNAATTAQELPRSPSFCKGLAVNEPLLPINFCLLLGETSVNSVSSLEALEKSSQTGMLGQR
eukprot:TRINITY_DN110696_c0_g1_i1.p2 TRINITY_DN110696_c0_g1~~TRINITY_DN110696_c0_g1_i1.p2  ORF type:complete len:152 (-),score=22.24 TRINITY_DN110696_c0_g1_i1:37-492(-)